METAFMFLDDSETGSVQTPLPEKKVKSPSLGEKSVYTDSLDGGD